MMRRMAGMMGMPDMSAMMGGGGEDFDERALTQAPNAGANRKRTKKKQRHKKRK
jgi:2-iminoacetate synthase ThiH